MAAMGFLSVCLCVCICVCAHEAAPSLQHVSSSIVPYLFLDMGYLTEPGTGSIGLCLQASEFQGSICPSFLPQC